MGNNEIGEGVWLPEAGQQSTVPTQAVTCTHHADTEGGRAVLECVCGCVVVCGGKSD
jgi:hypothetical protein